LVVTRLPMRVVRHSKLCLATAFICFCSWIKFAADVNMIGSGRPTFPDTPPSAGADSEAA
jgi:hypothetical protein